MNQPLQTIDPAQHQRHKFIGGADIGTVIGVNPWRTRYDLWRDKRKPRVEGALSRRDPKARGIRWESVVAEMLVEQLQEQGHKVEVISSNRRYVDNTIPYLAAEIDFELRLDDDEEITNCELKTVHPFKIKDWGESGTDQLPTHYTAQVMHGLGVTRRRKGMLAALFGADELRAYPVAGDDAVIKFLRDRAVSFWTDHVLADVAPEASTLEDLAAMYPKELEGGTPLLADDGLVEAAVRLRACNSEIKAREAEALVLEMQIKKAMRDSVALLLPNGKTAAEWKLREGKALDHEMLKERDAKLYRECHKPWTSRVFTLKPFAVDGL